MQTISSPQLNQQLAADITPSRWSVIVPAAGKGTRLGYDKPKILYPIAGRPILEWLIDLLQPACETLVFSLSPQGAPFVLPELEKKIPGHYQTAVLDSRGMADSIYAGLQPVTSPFVIVIWGDQVGIHPSTLKNIMRIIEHSPNTVMALPLVKRKDPYVHYAIDKSGQFTHVLEKREGASMPPIGQSDCGLFAFKTPALQSVFQKEIEQGITLSKGTQEWNFLPLLPRFDHGGNSVVATRLTRVEESIGVNDTNDAAKLEAYLAKRKMT
jgi:bifunctional UDP-N-acetylglucosamine pyrophosphorylase / glucosamine-1-phosphate N-acetyltransferase